MLVHYVLLMFTRVISGGFDFALYCISLVQKLVLLKYARIISLL